MTPELKRLIKTGAQVSVSAGAALSLSHLLQQLSGHALWLPVSLRVAVEVFTTLIGTIIFQLVMNQRRVALAHVAPDAQDKVWARDLHRAVAFAIAAIVCFVAYMWLCAACVISWNASAWKPAHMNPDGTVDVSEIENFADVQHGQIYIPLFFPKKQQEYIDEVSRGNNAGKGGLKWIVDNEPDRLFDWLGADLRMNLMYTSAIFLVVHLSIVSCVAASAALAGARWGSESTSPETADAPAT